MVEKSPKDMAQQRAYRAFEALIEGEDSAIDLAQAALIIASVEYPDLDRTRCMDSLDALGRRVREILALPSPDELSELPEPTAPLVIIDAINKVLFEEEHFHGNETDYYDPANSFLNRVLERQTGIPVSLSLLYMEVGKRVGLQIDGIGLPFYFLVRCKLGDGRVIYVDPFAEGQLLSERDCRERVRRIGRNKMKINQHWFDPVSNRQMLTRLLNNLKKIYMDREDYERALSICDLLVLLVPHA